jgi:hypothetical protein
MKLTFNPLTGKFDYLVSTGTEVAIVDTGGYYTGAEVETALQEIGAGTTLDSRYLKIASNLADLDDVGTARTNLGLVSGGSGDIWVEKTGDTMTGALVIDGSGDVVQATIQAHSTQTANIVEIQDSSANVLAGVDERGILFSDGGIDVNSVYIGANAGNISHTDATQNVGIGTGVLDALTTGDGNVALGYSSLTLLTTGEYSFGLGTYALSAATTSDRSVGIGAYAGSRIQTGNDNIFIGYQAGYGAFVNQTGVDRNTIIGGQAGYKLTTGKDGNVLIGYKAGFNSVADKNTYIGLQSGYSTTSGASNIYLGYAAGLYQTTASNTLLIDNQLRADAATELSHSIIYGVMAANPESQSLRFNADTFTFGTDADADITVNFVANSNSGVLKWMEDEDYFQFDDTVKTSAGSIVNTTRVTTTYTVLVSDHVIYADTDGGAFTITLPAGVEGQHFKIVNCGTGGYSLTVDGNGTEKIYNSLTQVVTDGDVIDLHYNATEGWW